MKGPIPIILGLMDLDPASENKIRKSFFVINAILSGRRESVKTPDLPQNRAYGSVHGGSVQ